MSIEQIETAAGVGNSTIYRWRDGKWDNEPRPTSVRRFCLGLGAPLSEAYAALGWSEQDQSRASSPEPLIQDPDVRALMRRLTSPETTTAEKLLIRRAIRALAGQSEDN